MATITWLHLSDFHACTPRSGWDAARVTETLISDLEELQAEAGLRPDLVFFTGDAAFGEIGTEPGETVRGQLEYFAEFLAEVRRVYVPEVALEDCFLVPGNHDVVRRLVSEDVTFWLDHQHDAATVGRRMQEAGIGWRHTMERLEAYRRFLDDHGFRHLLADPERLIFSEERRVAGLRVGIAGFNSAWSCGRDGERGQLWMAAKWQQGTLRPGIKDADFAIALVHHPASWLVEYESDFERALRLDYRFLLHGHEHQAWVEPTAGGHTTISAGACYDRSDKENGYNLVRLDTVSGRGEVWLRRYDDTGGGWIRRQIAGVTDDRGVVALDLEWLQSHAGAGAADTDKTEVSAPATEPATAVPEAAGVDAWDREVARYLRRLRAAHRDLPVAGFETRVRMPIRLDQVYIPLRTRVDPRLHGGDEPKRTGAPTKPDGRTPEAFGEESDVPFDEAPCLALELGLRGLVILGAPGSGKTTLLRHFVLAATEPSEGPARLGLEEGTLPVFVALRRLAEPAAGLEAAVRDAVERADPGADAEAFSRRLLRRDRLLVLVDGLDEVADASERAAVSRWLEDAIRRLPASTFVVTSRPTGYRDDSRLAGTFLELRVRDLDEAEARGFVSAWYEAVETQPALDRDPADGRHRARQSAADLAERIFNPEDPRTSSLRQLAANPLMLQILCLVHRDRKHLPEQRVELYRECVQVLLELWRRAKGIPVDLPAREALKLLQPLAWWLHREGRKEAELDAILPHLERPLAEIGRPPEDGAKLLAAIRDQSGVLVSLGQQHYGFLHLSFQEYLCARHVQDRTLDEPRLLRELAAHYGETWWREVLLLAVGLDNPSLFERLMTEFLANEVLHRDRRLADDCLLDALAITPRPFLEALGAGISNAEERYQALRLLHSLPGWESETLPPGSNWLGKLWHFLAGESASGAFRGAELIRRLATEDDDPKVRRLAAELLTGEVKAAVAESLPGKMKMSGGKVSGPAPAVAGSERVHDRDGSVLVYVPEGEYILGSDEIDDEEKPVHRVRLSPFWISKYPVTNAQYRRFLEAEPGQEKPRLWEDKDFNQDRQPVVGVSWDDAMAYCRWAGLSLPSEAQWEAAARGTDRRRFPWGDDEPTPEHANFDGREGKTTAVDTYPAGAGPYGTFDQAGNVWEWCADVFADNAYADRDGSLDPIGERGDASLRVVRGGSWDFPVRYLQAAYRNGDRVRYRLRDLGFRCVFRSPAEP